MNTTLVRLAANEYMPRIAGLGDLVSDVQGLYAMTTAQARPGGLRGYLSSIKADFDKLPADVRGLRAQLAAVASVLKAANGDQSPLANATRDLAQITAQLPTAKQKINTLVVELAPYLGDIENGNVTTEMVTQLAAHGADVVGTFNDVNALFTQRDDARAKIQQAIANPQLSPTVQQAAADAYANATPSLLGGIETGSVLQIALYAAAAYVAVSVFKGKNR